MTSRSCASCSGVPENATNVFLFGILLRSFSGISIVGWLVSVLYIRFFTTSRIVIFFTKRGVFVRNETKNRLQYGKSIQLQNRTERAAAFGRNAGLLSGSCKTEGNSYRATPHNCICGLRRRKLCILRFALLRAKAQSRRCSSFPHQTHFVGLWWGPQGLFPHKSAVKT